MNILNLPIVMIEHIFSYLSYDEVARIRIICKTFNETSMRLLNRGFSLIEKQHSHSLKHVKAQLPRRESERRFHPLSRHCDILASVETRISMLNMTYAKFIDSRICCFIPGKVIDEIRRILQIVSTDNGNLPRAHEVLQELRDISSMAIEHFDDKISPAFRKKLQEDLIAIEHVPVSLRQDIQNFNRKTVTTTKLCLFIANRCRKLQKELQMIKKMRRSQAKTIATLTAKQNTQDATIAELRRRLDECDVKYRELSHSKQATAGKAIPAQSTSPEPSPSLSPPLRHFSSQIKLDLSVLPIGTSKSTHGVATPNIKPRKSVMKLPSVEENEGNLSQEEHNPKEKANESQMKAQVNDQSGPPKLIAPVYENYKTLSIANMIQNKFKKRSCNTADDDEINDNRKKRKLD